MWQEVIALPMIEHNDSGDLPILFFTVPKQYFSYINYNIFLHENRDYC